MAGNQVERSLLRPINIAIGFMLARLSVPNYLKSFSSNNPDVPVTLSWGTKSEIVSDSEMDVAIRDLKRSTKSLKTIRLEGQKHALANDVHLHAAIILQALSHVKI